MEINVSPRWSRLSCQLCTTLNGRLSVPRPTSPRHRCWDVKFQIGNPAVDFPRQESIEDSALQAAIEIFSSSFLFFFLFFSSFLSSPFQILVYAFNRLCVEDQLNHTERALTGVINELAELFTSLKVKSKKQKQNKNHYRMNFSFLSHQLHPCHAFVLITPQITVSIATASFRILYCFFFVRKKVDISSKARRCVYIQVLKKEVVQENAIHLYARYGMHDLIFCFDLNN